MFPSKEEMEARASAPKDIVALYQAAIDSVPDGPFKDGLKLGKDQIEEEKDCMDELIDDAPEVRAELVDGNELM